MNPHYTIRSPRLLPSAISLAILTLASGVQAQTESAKPAVVETVVISGYRASLETALNKKREDGGIVDVIKSEDIGKFPDTNLAEALQRVPGVVIDRDAGEGRSITVRGLGQDFTRVRINGVEGLATTGGTDSSGGANRSRGFDFNVFSADLFNSLTVRKSSSADVDEGSLGATVELQTSRPFDLKKGLTAVVGLKGQYNDLSGKATPKGNFLLSNTFADNKIGVLLSGAYSKRQLLEEGFSTVRWDNGPSSGGWCPPQGATIATGTTLPSGSTATTCGPAAQGVLRAANTTESRHAGMQDPGQAAVVLQVGQQQQPHMRQRPCQQPGPGAARWQARRQPKPGKYSAAGQIGQQMPDAPMHKGSAEGAPGLSDKHFGLPVKPIGRQGPSQHGAGCEHSRQQGPGAQEKTACHSASTASR